MTRIILFAAAIFMLNSGTTSSATTNAEKTNPGNELQASSREVASKTYDQPLFPAVKDGKYGFIDLTGSFVIPPIFTAARHFSEGMAAVSIGGRAFIESSTHEGDGAVQYISSEKDKWGYIDRTGDIKISPQFGAADAFSEALALVALVDESPSREEFLEVAGPDNPDHSQAELTAYWEKTFNQDKKYGTLTLRDYSRFFQDLAAGPLNLRTGLPLFC